MEYKWAEADGSLTSMSLTGSKVCFFFGGMFPWIFFSCRFNVVFLETSNFSKEEKVSFYYVGVKVGVPSSQEVVFYRCFQ